MPDEDESSSLSSAQTNITAYGEILMNVTIRLDRYHLPILEDRTIQILKACVEYLPRDGKCNLCKDILACEMDEEVFELARHLKSSLLAPCKNTTNHAHTPVCYNIEISAVSSLSRGLGGIRRG